MSHRNKNLNDPLSMEELIYLDHVLTNKHGMSVFEAHGLLSAIISGPHILPMQLSDILDESLAWNSMNKIKKVMNLMIRLNNQVAAALMEEALFFPLVDYVPVNSFSAEDLTDEQKSHLRVWCHGYMQGVGFNGEEWIQQGGEEHLGDLLVCLFTLSKEDPNIGILLKTLCSPNEVEAHQKRTIDLLPKLISTIYDFWRDKDRMRLANAIKSADCEVCSCGSGRLLEECCQFTGILH